MVAAVAGESLRLVAEGVYLRLHVNRPRSPLALAGETTTANGYAYAIKAESI
jgi:hypothetical protein